MPIVFPNMMLPQSQQQVY